MAERIVAVTGANGFVGRHVLRALGEAGLGALGLVRSESAEQAVREAGGRPRRIAGLDQVSLAPAFEGVEAVVHLAQIGAERGEASYETVNVEGTQAVAAASREAGVERIVFLSGLGVASYGIKARCTSAYFLSKLAAEQALFRSGREVVVFRPSYVVGPGSALVADLRAQIGSGSVEVVGSGRQRMQPVAVTDAAASIARASAGASPASGRPPHRVVDLVGPEPISVRDFVARLARVDQVGRWFEFREIPEQEADRQAAAGGYRDMLPDELDCLLCDETSDPAPLEGLLGRPLTPLDTLLAASRS